MTNTARSLALLRKSGYLAEVCERWIPRANVRRDLFQFADVIACHATRREIVLVQATSLSNVGARLRKAQNRHELRTWLASGGRFLVMGWKGREVRQVEVRAEDLAAVAVVVPRRRRVGTGHKQGELFA